MSLRRKLTPETLQASYTLNDALKDLFKSKDVTLCDRVPPVYDTEHAMFFRRTNASADALHDTAVNSMREYLNEATVFGRSFAVWLIEPTWGEEDATDGTGKTIQKLTFQILSLEKEPEQDPAVVRAQERAARQAAADAYVAQTDIERAVIDICTRAGFPVEGKSTGAKVPNNYVMQKPLEPLNVDTTFPTVVLATAWLDRHLSTYLAQQKQKRGCTKLWVVGGPHLDNTPDGLQMRFGACAV